MKKMKAAAQPTGFGDLLSESSLKLAEEAGLRPRNARKEASENGLEKEDLMYDNHPGS
jgi:hypothetical protein